MNRVTRFAPSKTPYALDLSTWRWEWMDRAGPVDSGGWPPRGVQEGGSAPANTIGGGCAAVWVKRADRETVAVVGRVGLAPYGFRGDVPEGISPEAYISGVAHDGRYGGDARSRLTETGKFWTTLNDYLAAGRDREFLQAVLDGLPVVPGGYDGWWTFT